MSICFNLISRQKLFVYDGVFKHSLGRQHLPLLCRGVVHESHHNYDGKDLYALLKVSPKATQKQIKTAYYNLSLIHHPDKNKESNKAHEIFTQITEAYKVLGSVHSRRNYDRSRRVRMKSLAQSSRFNESEIAAHKTVSSRHYDTWTLNHYSNAIKLRDERARRDQLRNEESHAENEAIKSRYAVVAAFFFLITPFVVFKKLFFSKKGNTKS